MKVLRGLALLAGVAGCVSTTASQNVQPIERVEHFGTIHTNGKGMSEQDFLRVAGRIEIVAESFCHEARTRGNCDFLIVMDDRAHQPSNAYQFLSENGRPVLAVTISLLDEVQNDDELAFVIGHEAAHHVAGHLEQQMAMASQGAMLGSFTATILGADPEAIETARDIGAFVGSRQFSKQHELEADQLGALIALEAGFDPEIGVAYFTRIPDPGEEFLGSHPSNADRIETVRSAVYGA
ncbi:M48 family metalloprotease [Falsihalocynthiibacter sp. S25ZX9]|uniref:M48 family metalloprotease n=1 Tax=Falsihalocynthiibacter sp. S25ZX9 TaxID=3240870 RepID=UPI00350FE327